MVSDGSNNFERQYVAKHIAYRSGPYLAIRATDREQPDSLGGQTPLFDCTTYPSTTFQYISNRGTRINIVGEFACVSIELSKEREVFVQSIVVAGVFKAFRPVFTA